MSSEPLDAVDCDVHCAPASFAALAPYLSEYWRKFIEGAAISLGGTAGQYPPGMRTTGNLAAQEAAGDGAAQGQRAYLLGGRAAGPTSPPDYETLKQHLLDITSPRYAVLNCLTLCEATRSPAYGTAVAAAINDWLREEWLSRDDRLRASIVVSTLDIATATAEIERLAGDSRFVQVLLPVRTDIPYGNNRYHPIYEAAVSSGLAIGLHAWGPALHAPTPTGVTRTYLQDYLSNRQVVQAQVVSLVTEGVFSLFPDIRVSLMECGFAWLPPLLWRFDKDWKGLWREVPWVKQKPSEYILRHMRATSAPAQLPSDAGAARLIVDTIGADWLMYASDFPHAHGEGGCTLAAVLNTEEREDFLRRTATDFYRLPA